MAFELCSKGHEEICYDGKNYCPVCEKIDELEKKHEEEMNDLSADYEEDIKELEARLRRIENFFGEALNEIESKQTEKEGI